MLYALGFHFIHTDASYRLSGIRDVFNRSDQSAHGAKASWHRSLYCMFNGRVRDLDTEKVRYRPLSVDLCSLTSVAVLCI